MPKPIFILAVSYFLGSIPFGYLLVRIFRGEDVRRSGSGNIGATNVARRSPALGALTLLLDALKGSAAVLLGVIWSSRVWPIRWHITQSASSSAQCATWAAMAALFAILGHMFPVWLRFRGGKGVATGLGAFVLIAPKAVLCAAGLFVGIVLVFRYVSLGSIIAVMLFPSLAWALNEFGGTWRALTAMSLASLAIVLKHHQNIRRLLAGTESRIGARPAVNQGNE